MRLIDADKADRRIRQFLCGGCDDYHNCGNCLANKALSLLRGEQTVDVEPVVRCKECKYLEEDECPWTGVIDWNGYCSRGEKRKESGQNA